jgi:hypothetical protein
MPLTTRATYTKQHSLPPPRSHQGPSLFELLPLHLTQDILHRAGPRSRLLCKRLANLYGSLPSLTPRGLKSGEDLLSALPRLCRHRELTTLDLTQAPDLVTDSNLGVICKALPHIQQLHLPVTTLEVARRLAAQPTLLPSLTALHVFGPSALPFSPWRSFDVDRFMDLLAPLSQLRELTLPASTAYHVSKHAKHMPKLTACSRLTFSDHPNDDVNVCLYTEYMVICAQHLPALVSLVIDVRGWLHSTPRALQQLQGLTMLTDLEVGTIRPRFSHAPTMIGTITGLQSLRLRLLSESWAPAEDSCLARLSLLTSLHVALEPFWLIYQAHEDLYHGDRLLAAVPHLPPSLQDLQLTISSCSEKYVGAAPSSGLFAGLASASSVLQLLELKYLTLPGNFMEVIQQLTRLTTLGIHDCDCTAGGSFAGLTALTSLRKLALCDMEGGSTEGCSSIEGMKQLHTLQLNGSFMDGPYLASLCAASPQLQVLDISGSHCIASGLSALALLTALEVVDLSDTVEVHQLERCLRAPPSLRRCHLSFLQPWEQQRAAALLGPLVEVVFT